MISSLFGSYDAQNSIGLPISYKFRHLDGSLAKVQETNEYDIKKIEYKPKKLISWSALDELLNSGEINKLSTLKIDLRKMVDYSDINNTDNVADKNITIPSNIKELYLLGPNNLTENITSFTCL
jgi:hypothetical protein